MYQQEIQFFWPLTEQIPLDLDYSDCVKPNLSVNHAFPFSVATVAWGTGSSIGYGVGETSFRFRENQTTMLVIKKPNLLRKLLFKLIGFNWEVK